MISRHGSHWKMRPCFSIGSQQAGHRGFIGSSKCLKLGWPTYLEQCEQAVLSATHSLAQGIRWRVGASARRAAWRGLDRVARSSLGKGKPSRIDHPILVIQEPLEWIVPELSITIGYKRKACAEFALEPCPRFCASHWVGLTAIHAAQLTPARFLHEHKPHCLVAHRAKRCS